MENTDLTPRQLEILKYIVTYTFQHLYQPSIREIGDQFKIRSSNGVADHLKCLLRKGYLKSGNQFKPRALPLTDKALLLLNEDTPGLRATPKFSVTPLEVL